MSDDDRAFQARVAQNEVRFRAVNEDVERGRPSGDAETLVPFVCECGHIECHKLIELTPAEYAGVRSDERTFAITPGHELPVAEEVVSSGERFSVVRKTGVGADVAREG